MEKSGRTHTMTESFAENAKTFGDDLLKAGANVFHAGVGVCAATEDQVRDTFDRMVHRGKDYESDEQRLFSRATREARELGKQLEQRVESTVTATLKRAGVPGRDEIERLSRRVEALTHKVDELAASRSTDREESDG